MKHVVSFSGGKDSTAMLLMMIERNMQIDKILCVDTTKEFPEMYEHIQKVQDFIQPLQIEIVKIDFDYWFGEHIKAKGKYIGEKGYGWPDFRLRWCTALKREAVNKIKSKMGKNISYLGIAADEPDRFDKNKDAVIRHPLVEWGVTEAQALQYCYDRGFTWGGLYEKFARVSCFCCPLQRIGELRILHNEFPELWQQIKEMNKLSPRRRFRPRETVEELEERFKRENRQPKLPGLF